MALSDSLAPSRLAFSHAGEGGLLEVRSEALDRRRGARQRVASAPGHMSGRQTWSPAAPMQRFLRTPAAVSRPSSVIQ